MSRSLARTDVTPIPKAGKPKPARRKPLPVYSDKRFSEKELRAALVEKVKSRDGHRCRARLLVPAVTCGGPLDVHEIIPRSAWRAGYLVASNALTIYNNPAEAHRLGLHGYSWDRPTKGRTA